MATSSVEDAREIGQPRAEIPQPGRIVEVRGATWAVSELRTQGLLRSPADEARHGDQHVVALQSLDEDRLGEELSVVWELEVGTAVVPERGLPTSIGATDFDDPNVLGAFIDAVRWGAVTSADASAYQAPFRSGVHINAYQLEPLRRALESPRTNLLLADDVGLGKTIEAGLVVQELLLRHRARTAIIVCPPSLALKWQDEMREKFGLEFVIVNSELMAQVRRTHGLAANPFRLYPRVIVSMAWLPGARAQRLLRGVLADVARTNSARRYAFDILIVDEAHHVAPASPTAVGGGRGYAVDSKRTIATRALAERCEHRLFLSATPHNGHSESFTALMEMIDNRRFSRGATLDERALRDVTVRRLKTATPGMAFKTRKINPISFTPTDDEDQQFADLDRLLKQRARAQGERSLDIVSLLLKKRFLSSAWAFARTLAAYRDASVTGRDPEFDDDYYAEVLGSEQNDEEEGLFEQPELSGLRQAKCDDSLATADEIDRLIRWAEGYEHRASSKAKALLRLLDAVCREGDGWSNERVVIFTEYADTLEWLVDILGQHGYADVVETIQGSTPAEDRELTRERFTKPPTEYPVRVLVATDAAGEGIDLQDHCHRLINFDVPFNPSRLEQRIGRIDRYGQDETPEIYYFAPDRTTSLYAGDLDFMHRIAQKVSTVETDLGSVNPLIDDDIQQHFTPRSQRLRRAQPTDKGAEVINKTLAESLTLNQRLTELSRDYAQRKEAMHLTPFNARRVVDTALTLTAQPQLRAVVDVDEVYEVPTLGQQWQAALRGLDTRLNPGVPRPITFDEDAARRRPDLVHVHLGHALMQKAARVLRSSLLGFDAQLHRVTAVVVDDLSESCVAALSRLVLVGRGGLRLHEEVFLTGVRFKGQALAEQKAEAVLDRALDAGDLRLADPVVRNQLTAEWNAADSRLRSRLESAVQRRAEAKQRAVTDSLDARRDADIDRARQVFAAFRTNLTDSLSALRREHQDQQQMLLPDDQQRQRLHDINAMESRLFSLADEEAREVAGLQDRYADVRPFVSTAAVVFAIMPADAEAWAGVR